MICQDPLHSGRLCTNALCFRGICRSCLASGKLAREPIAQPPAADEFWRLAANTLNLDLATVEIADGVCNPATDAAFQCPHCRVGQIPDAPAPKPVRVSYRFDGPCIVRRRDLTDVGDATNTWDACVGAYRDSYFAPEAWFEEAPPPPETRSPEGDEGPTIVAATDRTGARVLMRCSAPPVPLAACERDARALIDLARQLAAAHDSDGRAFWRAEMQALVAAWGASWADIHLPEQPERQHIRVGPA
jgi:hypothetical protein